MSFHNGKLRKNHGYPKYMIKLVLVSLHLLKYTWIWPKIIRFKYVCITWNNV